MLPQIEQMRDLFYRCQFTRLLDILHVYHTSEYSVQTSTEYYESLVMKANALFELHRVPESKDTLRQLAESPDHASNEGYLYAMARLRYMEDDFEGAQKIFVTMLNESESATYQFRALLGIANTLYSLKKFDLIPDIIDRAKSFEPLKSDDDRIGLLMFLANYYRVTGSVDTARVYFKRVISTAAKKSWVYCIARALYGLAITAQQTQQPRELDYNLELLEAILSESEWKYFQYVVNSRFRNNHPVLTQIDFDPQNSRIFVNGRWVPLTKRKELYAFLTHLHGHQSFQSVESISRALWPAETYAPELHSDKIAQIANEAIKLIEVYETQPKILLKSDTGYRLASQ